MIESQEYKPFVRDRVKKFVEYVYAKIKDDNGARSRFRGALSSSRSYTSWGDIAPYMNIEDESTRDACSLICGSIALDEPDGVKSLGLGSALQKCCLDAEDGEKGGPCSNRLRRLISCRTTKELCRVLRPILSLVRSRCPGGLDYALLLEELLDYEDHQDKIKARWVGGFYRSGEKETEK